MHGHGAINGFLSDPNLPQCSTLEKCFLPIYSWLGDYTK